MGVKVNKEKPVMKEAPAGKGASLDHILGQVRKVKGDLVAVKGNEIPDVERIPTGVFEFDLGIGGGFPKGRISIVYGAESSGKTNLTLKAIAHVQKHFPKNCNRCVFVNLEGTFDPKWASRMGVDVDQLDVVNPAYGEEAVDLVDAVMRADDLALCVVDSLAVMVAAREIEASAEKADVATNPFLARRLVNKIVVALAEEARKGHYPAAILINQRRFKVGVMFGDPEIMGGGEAPKFLSSLTVRLYGRNVLDKNIHPEIPCWKETEVTVKKSKVPITSSSFKYSMAMIPTDDLEVGGTDSWNEVRGHLQASGALAKKGTEWLLFGEPYPTLIAIEEQYLGDSTFRVRCQQEVVKMVSDKKFVVTGDE